MKKKILIVGWGTYTADYAFEVAKRKNLDVYLATAKFYPDWVKQYVKSKNIIYTDTYNTDRLLTDVISFCKNNSIEFEAICSYFELNITHASILSSVLRLPGIPPEAARRSSANKLLMREACVKKNIPGPKFRAFSNDKEAIEAFKLIGKPSVIKPVMFGHSYGVIKVERNDSVEDFLKKIRLAKNQLNPKYYPMMKDYHQFNNRFLLEEFLKGPVISVDGLIQDDRIMICGITKFTLTKDESFTQESALIPADLSDSIRRLCFSETKKIVKALGFNNCGFHCEMVLNGNKPILLEIAARLPGGKMSYGYQNAYGVDMMSMYLDICTGTKVNWSFKEHQNVVFHHSIFIQNWGEITKFEGLNKLQKKPYFKLFWAAKTGELILPVTGIPEPVAYYQIKGKSLDHVKHYQNEIQKSFTYTVTKTPKAIKERLKRSINRILL
jgi:hypothetical protein